MNYLKNKIIKNSLLKLEEHKIKVYRTKCIKVNDKN